MSETELLSGIVDTREAAQILGRTAKTISIYVSEGQLTPVKRGHGLRGAFLFRRADVEALAEFKAEELARKNAEQA